MIEGILLDIGGVLYVGDEAVPGAVDALQRLRAQGPPVRFLTNTTRKPRRAVARDLATMHFAIAETQLFTAPMAARDYLQTHGLRPYLICHPNLEEEFSDLISDQANAVVVGDAGEHFTYRRLNEAFRLLMDGAVLIAMGRNRYFKEADGLSLDAGPFVAALENAAGVEAVVAGKPSADFFAAAARDLGCQPQNIVMVGDDVDADVIGAMQAGLQGVLVQTGKYRRGDEAKLSGTDSRVVPNFPAFVEWMIGQQAQP